MSQVVALVGGAMGGAWIDQLEAILITNAVNLWFSETLSTRAVYKLAKREKREREREGGREKKRERGREENTQSKHLKSVYISGNFR